MAKLSPVDVLNWFKEVEPDAGRQMLLLAEEAITNRAPAEPKAARKPRGPNKNRRAAEENKDGNQGQGQAA